MTHSTFPCAPQLSSALPELHSAQYVTSVARVDTLMKLPRAPSPMYSTANAARFGGVGLTGSESGCGGHMTAHHLFHEHTDDARGRSSLQYCNNGFGALMLQEEQTSAMSARTINNSSPSEPVPVHSSANIQPHAHLPTPRQRRANGCFECSQRRIACDRAEPRCQKCRDKGLECSGQGLRVRFTDGLASRRNPIVSRPTSSRSRKTPSEPSPITLRWTAFSTNDIKRRQPRKRHLTWTDFVDAEQREKRADLPQRLEFGVLTAEPASPTCDRSDISSPLSQPESTSDDAVQMWHEFSPSILPHVEFSSPQVRRLLQHFSEEVAPAMVVLDRCSNGYRDIILPLAVEDAAVRRALVVVAAHHLAPKVPALRKVAMDGQMAIVHTLRSDSVQADQSKVFSLSNLAIVLILLVGDTVTGSNDLLHLLGLLRFIMQSKRTMEGLTAPVREFLTRQARMFELFGFPLSQDRTAVQTLRQDQQKHLEFMDYAVPLEPTHSVSLQNLRAATETACEIYCRRAESNLIPADSCVLVEEVQQRTSHLNPDLEGNHALAWTYLIAAAESSLPAHRAYFTSRLGSLFDRTGLRSILVGLSKLSDLWLAEAGWTNMLVTNEVGPLGSQ